MIKGQIEEELRQLEDEIAACKWTHTHTHKTNHGVCVVESRLYNGLLITTIWHCVDFLV